MEQDSRKLDFKEATFEANGNKYRIMKSIPLGRFEAFDILQTEASYGITIQTIVQEDATVLEFLNKQKFIEAGNIIINRVQRLNGKITKEKTDATLKLCTIFIVREDEDVKLWDETIAREKIEDWIAEGIDSTSFFQLAFSSLNIFTDILNQSSQDTSKKETAK